MRSHPDFLLLVALLIAGPVLTFSADRDFDSLVRDLESHYQIERTRIPLMGMVNFFTATTRPQGVKNIQLAVFEGFSATDAQAAEFDQLVRRRFGTQWTPMVTVRSREKRERTTIYVRETGRDCTLLIGTFEDNEAVVVQVKLSLARLLEMMHEPGSLGRRLRSSHD
jgi:hypothetical protein